MDMTEIRLLQESALNQPKGSVVLLPTSLAETLIAQGKAERLVTKAVTEGSGPTVQNKAIRRKLANKAIEGQQ